jgi:transposase InsO family protein
MWVCHRSRSTLAPAQRLWGRSSRSPNGLTWAYAQAYQKFRGVAAELLAWLHRYNWHRPHASLKAKPPISRLGLTEDNVLRFHS